MIKKFNSIGKEEEEAVLRVIRSGSLSGYDALRELGGPETEALGQEWGKVFNVHAIPCNSATSGLMAACMVANVKSYEVIVPDITMSATAAAPILLGAHIKVAHVDPDTFCIDVNHVAELINYNTRAVIAVNMFGHPARLRDLKRLCEAHNIILIEDNSQAPFAKEYNKLTGTVGDIGVFSLNVHKHMQTGEGGIVCTDSDFYKDMLRASINHGECRGWRTGANFRMTEITAAIAREQLKKGSALAASRIAFAEQLTSELIGLGLDKSLKLPTVRDECSHVYYAYPITCREGSYIDSEVVNILLGGLGVGSAIGYCGVGSIFPNEDISSMANRKRNFPHLTLEMCSCDPTGKEIERIADIIKRHVYDRR